MMKRLLIICKILLSFILFTTLAVVQYANAEKEPYYTSDDEFLPLGTSIEEEDDEDQLEFLQDETLIKNAKIKGIKLSKEEKRLSFLLAADTPETIENRDLKFSINILNFPPRIIVHLYGVTSEEKVFHFFKNLEIVGVVGNPFLERYYTEYVIFFKDWVNAVGTYRQEEKRLILEYHLQEPETRRGYGVRIADTKIDPLPQVIEIYNELKKYGLQCTLLIASDQETVVLESPFYGKKSEAIEYIEALENFGFKGKLAIRDYLDFPQPNRFDVISEVVITGEDDVNLKNLVYSEFSPEKIYSLSHSDLFRLSKNIFSPRIQNNEDAIGEYYYKLSEIYKNYETEDIAVREKAVLVSVKMQEIIIYNYPRSQSADDALWEMGNTIREYDIKDILDEEDCYRKLIADYPESIFIEEAKVRLQLMESFHSEQY